MGFLLTFWIGFWQVSVHFDQKFVFIDESFLFCFFWGGQMEGFGYVS
jgi:hypothetical protein